MTFDEELDEQEQRSRGSQKARAHVVTLDRCPCCGTRLGARDVAAIKRGEQQCPRRPRPRPIVDAPPPGALADAADALAAHDRAWGAA